MSHAKAQDAKKTYSLFATRKMPSLISDPPQLMRSPSFFCFKPWWLCLLEITCSKKCKLLLRFCEGFIYKHHFLTLPRVVMGDYSQNTTSLGLFEILGNLMKDLFVEDKLLIFYLFVNRNHQQFQYPRHFIIGFFLTRETAYRNFQLEKLAYWR